MTGHNEVVLVVYDPAVISLESLLKVFWESHDPTQGMRQGNDRGTQYRSGIYYFDEMQRDQALSSLQKYQEKLSASGYNNVTTEVVAAAEFLLCRRISPAVSGKKSCRLLWFERYRSIVLIIILKTSRK